MDIDGLISEHLAPIVEDGSAPGVAVGVLHEGARTIRTLGDARTDGLFDIGSITKTFTGLLLAEMHERGELDVEDPIERFLPAATKTPSQGGRHITLLDLVTQSSGLPRLAPGQMRRALLHMSDPYRGETPEFLYKALGKTKLKAPIGTAFEYSNFGFSLLGTMLGRAAGSDYATALRERVLEPLHLSDTTVGPVTDERRQQGHGKGRPVPDWTKPCPGAGGVWSTTSDLLDYLDALMSAAMPAIKRAQTTVRDAAQGRRVAYAWLTANVPGRDVLWHNGGTGGFSSMAMFEPGGSTAIVGLANGAPDRKAPLDKAVADVMRALLGAPAA